MLQVAEYYRIADVTLYLFFYYVLSHVNQMTIEKKSWPYYFALSEDFQKTEQRGCVSGKLLVRDRYPASS
jgi:hypothetical protein